jgi:hypothetical protein
MPGPQPYRVVLSDKQQELLKRLCRRQTSPQRLVRRAKTILLAAEGLSNESVATQLGISRTSVSLAIAIAHCSNAFNRCSKMPRGQEHRVTSVPSNWPRSSRWPVNRLKIQGDRSPIGRPGSFEMK